MLFVYMCSCYLGILYVHSWWYMENVAYSDDNATDVSINITDTAFQMMLKNK